MQLPDELEKFALEFANKKNQLAVGEYFSNEGTFTIKYSESIPNTQTDGRISYYDGFIEISKERVSNKSNDYIYFLISVLYFTLFLDKNTEDKYAENLIKCDMLAITNAKNNGLNIGNIIFDFNEMFKRVPSKLNRRRHKQLINI